MLKINKNYISFFCFELLCACASGQAMDHADAKHYVQPNQNRVVIDAVDYGIVWRRHEREYFKVSDELRRLDGLRGDHVRQILKRVFAPWLTNESRFSLLEIIILSNSRRALPAILDLDRNLDLNVPFASSGLTPLEMAIKLRNTNSIEVLLAARDRSGRPRVDVNRLGAHGYPVHIAAAGEYASDCVYILQLLYVAGARFDVAYNGQTLLEVARKHWQYDGDRRVEVVNQVNLVRRLESNTKILSRWSWRNCLGRLIENLFILAAIIYNHPTHEDSYWHIS